MKKYLILFGLFITTAPAFAQTVVVNEKLLIQLTKNQAVRKTSNTSFFNSFEKQQKLYNDINQKLTQVVAIQEFIYQSLANIDYALKQSKQLYYLYQYLAKIGSNASTLVSLTAANPEYAILQAKYYTAISNELTTLYTNVSTQIMNESSDFLMDPYDRQKIIEEALSRARTINGWILYIIGLLERGKSIPYINQIPVIKGWVNIDRAIVQDIFRKYQYLKY